MIYEPFVGGGYTVKIKSEEKTKGWVSPSERFNLLCETYPGEITIFEHVIAQILRAYQRVYPVSDARFIFHRGGCGIKGQLQWKGGTNLLNAVNKVADAAADESGGYVVADIDRGFLQGIADIIKVLVGIVIEKDKSAFVYFDACQLDELGWGIGPADQSDRELFSLADLIGQICPCRSEV